MNGLPPDTPEQSDTAACRETRRYIDENVPPPEWARLTEERENGGKHIALRVLFGMPIPAHTPDPLLDLAAVNAMIPMLSQETSVAHAERLDRALDWATRDSTSVEAAVLLAHHIISADTAGMPAWQARGHQGLRSRAAYRRFKAARGTYLPAADDGS